MKKLTFEIEPFNDEHYWNCHSEQLKEFLADLNRDECYDGFEDILTKKLQLKKVVEENVPKSIMSNSALYSDSDLIGEEDLYYYIRYVIYLNEDVDVFSPELKAICEKVRNEIPDIITKILF